MTSDYRPNILKEAEQISMDIQETMQEFHDYEDEEFVRSWHYQEIFLAFQCMSFGPGHIACQWSLRKKLQFLKELRSRSWVAEGLEAIDDKYDDRVHSYRLMRTMAKKQYFRILLRFYYYHLQELRRRLKNK